MGSILETMGGNPIALLGLITSIVFVGAAYFIVTLDRGRANSPLKDDPQVGIKLVLYGLALGGIQLAAGGADTFLGYALGGFKGGSIGMRVALPPMLVGGLTVVLILKVLLPRTNDATQKQPERYALGAVAIQYGSLALLSLTGVLNFLLLEAPWEYTSKSLASTAVYGAVAFLGITRLGARSGWTMAPPTQRPAQGYPPQQGGGYPPQGGGYPPQGGGYPPQGGGYPPQGGGGYPPR